MRGAMGVGQGVKVSNRTGLRGGAIARGGPARYAASEGR